MTNRWRQNLKKLLCLIALLTCVRSIPSVANERADVGIILRGYEASTLFPTAASFDVFAQRIMHYLELLSLGKVRTYAIYDAGIDTRGPSLMQMRKDVEVSQAALEGWPSPDWAWVLNYDPLVNPTDSERELI